jgi:pimeloyl-ACP methyl ester carboxylesterase
MGFLIAVAAFYLILTLFLMYLLHQIPRRPIQDEPDWGRVKDVQIPAVDGGMLEAWVVEPDISSEGTVLLSHGWSRNRDRMTGRARIFGKLGFRTVFHSARDHGNSTPNRSMNAFRFAEDIEAVLNWLDEPVLLYGHSAGAAGAILAASRQPDRIRLLFLEGCYARTKEGLRGLYRSVNPVFGLVFGPMIVLWMDIYYRFQMDAVSPERLAKTSMYRFCSFTAKKTGVFPFTMPGACGTLSPKAARNCLWPRAPTTATRAWTHDTPRPSNFLCQDT